MLLKCKVSQSNKGIGAEEAFVDENLTAQLLVNEPKGMGSLSRKITKLRKYNILFQIIRKFLLIENGLIRYIVLLPRRYSPDIRSGRPNQVCPQRLTFKFIHGLSDGIRR